MIILREQDPALKRILPPGKADPETVYVRSRFAFPFEEGGRRIRFHLLTRQMAELTRPLPERISGKELLRDGEYAALAEGYFLVPEGKDETEFYLGIFGILHTLARKKGIGGYTILPTSACNARCVYCFEQGRKQITMTPETADRTADYILRTRRSGETVIQWFGGEPLLAVPVIDRICGRLRAEGIPFSGAVVTNGSLITGSLADRMREDWHVKQVQVSMDGNEADYTARKRYVREDGVYRRVLRGIRALTERDIRTAVRCNVDGENLGGLEDFLRDLSEAVPEKKNLRVHLSPLNAVRGSCQAPEFWKRIAAARPVIQRFGFDTRDSRFTLHNLRNFHCMADLGSAVIDAEGGLYACEECPPEARTGSLEEGENPEARARFADLTRVREECRDCPFLPACTPFASCPVRKERCREVRSFLLQEQIRAYLENPDRTEAEEEERKEC